MPKLSKRAEVMPPSPIRKLVPFAEEAKKKGRTVYHLNIGQPDINTPEVALEAIRNFDKKVVEYSHSAGIESYRRGLANYYQKIGVDVDFNDIIVTTGGSEALVFAMMTALNPGDEIIIPEPFYTNYNSFSVFANIKVVPITSKIENDFALPPISEFVEKITDKTKAILVCNPSNPTGSLYSKEDLELLKEIVIEKDLFIISDEVYREFVYDGNTHTSVMQLEGLENNAVLIDSTSKRYSECGTRMGCLVSKNKELMASVLKFAQARLSPPTFGQVAGEASLNTPDSYFTEVYDEYIARRNFVVEELNKIEGVYAPKPKGAFYTIISLPIEDAEHFCQWLLEDYHFENQTVMLAPAAGFYATPNLGKNEVRIAYVLKIEDLKNAVKVIEEALKVYKGK